LVAKSGKGSLYLFVRPALASPHRCSGYFHFFPKKFFVSGLLMLLADIIAHKLANDLRSRPMGGLGRG
jgi:hypothetical protein